MSLKIGTVILTAALLFLSACTQSSSFFYAYDKGDCKSTRFEEVDRNLDIATQWKFETLYLTWGEYEGDDFSGYYIVRTDGDVDSCPFYFVGADYHEYISKKSITYFKDEEIESGETYYYRICVKETDMEIDCGGVKRVTIY